MTCISSLGILQELVEDLERRLADLGDTEIALVADGAPATLDGPTVVVAESPAPSSAAGYARVAAGDDELLEAAARLAAAGHQVVPSRLPPGIELPIADTDVEMVAAFHQAGSRAAAADAVGYSRSQFNRLLREACEGLGVDRPADAVLILDCLGMLP